MIKRKLFGTLDKSFLFNRDFNEFNSLDALLEFLNASKQNSIIASGSKLSFSPNFIDEKAKLISMGGLNKILKIDTQNNFVEVESGCTLIKLQNELLKKKLFIKIQPGWPLVTVGGCIANNIHGKNPLKDGVFKNIVKEIKLFSYKDKEIITIDSDNESELFDLTIGGFGLTGIILSCKIYFHKIQNTFITENRTPVTSFQESINKISNNNANLASFAWHDMSLGKNFSRGIVFSYDDNLKSSYSKEHSIINEKTIVDLKNLQQPINFFNPLSSKIINLIYYLSKVSKKQKIISLYEYLYPMLSFPIPYWFYFNGHTGFIEHEILIPKKSVNKYFDELKDLIRLEKIRIYGCFIKAFSGDQKYLNFEGEGISISMEILNNKDNLFKLSKLDELNCKYEAITCLYKDSRISKDIVRKQYGKNYQNFMQKISKYNLGFYSSYFAKKILF